MTTRTLYVAWQDPVSRRWFPVGRLDGAPGHYRFRYVRGAEAAGKKGFGRIASFADFNQAYEASELFAVFQNRLYGKTRPDLADHLERLALRPDEENDPLLILARNGGRRVTDSLELFPRPERSDDSKYRVHFFMHGIRHLSKDSQGAAAAQEPGEKLVLRPEPNNPVDPDAVEVRTATGHRVGWIPRYLTGDVHALLGAPGGAPQVTVVKVNLHPAPVQQRLLCCLETDWPDRFNALSGPEYQPMVP